MKKFCTYGIMINQRKGVKTVQRIEKMKLISKVKKNTKKLSVQILSAMCLICVPLNMLTILVAGIMLHNASVEVKNSYQRELSAAMERFEERLGEIENCADEFVMKYLTELMILDENDNMTSYEMVKDLGESFEKSEATGFFYLYNQKDGLLYVKYSKGKYKAWEAEQLKTALLETMPQGNNEEWECREWSRKWYYAKFYEYTNYRLGFLVDLEKNLSEIAVNSFPEYAAAYFSDKDKNLCMDENGIIGSEEGATVQTDKWQGTWVEWHSSLRENGFGVFIPGRKTAGSISAFYWMLLIISLAFVFLTIVFWKFLQNRVVRPLHVLQEGMTQLEEKNVTYRITNTDEKETEDFRYIYDVFNQMAEEIMLSHEKDIKMYQVQLDNLKLQVNPHMLLNSFNMIYGLAQSKNCECIQEFSLHLVEYFRYSLKETDTFVTLDKEMQFVDNYTEIQKIRFPGAFTSVHCVQEETMEALVPPLLIQNFVENAMKYALIPGKTIEVLINIRKEGERLLISICDTGRGIKPEVLQKLEKGEVYIDKMGHKHIGVWNCRRRMEVFYGEKTSMNIISTEGEGTQVWIDLPYMTDC